MTPLLTHLIYITLPTLCHVQLMLGPDTVGNFTYGASAALWQTKLNTLLNVDSIQVSE